MYARCVYIYIHRERERERKYNFNKNHIIKIYKFIIKNTKTYRSIPKKVKFQFSSIKKEEEGEKKLLKVHTLIQLIDAPFLFRLDQCEIDIF